MVMPWCQNQPARLLVTTTGLPSDCQEQISLISLDSVCVCVFSQPWFMSTLGITGTCLPGRAVGTTDRHSGITPRTPCPVAPCLSPKRQGHTPQGWHTKAGTHTQGHGHWPTVGIRRPKGLLGDWGACTHNTLVSFACAK